MRGATRALVVVAVVVGTVDVARRLTPRPASEALPSLPGFDPTEAVRVELSHGDDAVVLERRGEGWWLVGPAEVPADRQEVDASLEVLGRGIVPSARIDDGSDARYGFDGGEQLSIDVRGASTTLMSLVVGADTVGGDSFVRFPGAPDVFRATVGGRTSLARPAGRWRDRAVVDLDPATVEALVVSAGGRTVRTHRGAGGFDGGVDQATVERLIAELAHLRAAEVLDDGPVGLAEVELATADRTVRLSFGADPARTVVRRADRPGVFRLAVPWVAGLADPALLLDRAVWTEVPEAIGSVRLEGPGWDGWIRREPDGSLRLLRPANLAVDPARLSAAVALMSRPQVARWEATGTSFPGHRIVVEAGSTRRILEVGETEQDRVWVRDGDHPDRVGWMDAELVRKLLTVFGSPAL